MNNIRILSILLVFSAIVAGCGDAASPTGTDAVGTDASDGTGGSDVSGADVSGTDAGGTDAIEADGGAVDAMGDTSGADAGADSQGSPGLSSGALVSGGGMSASPSYTLLHTLGQPMAAHTNATSANYRLRGGLVGIIGGQ